MRLAKHPDLTSIESRTEFTLPRPADSDLPTLVFTLRALPQTFIDDAEEDLPSPEPPFKGYATNRRGRIMKDDDNRPVKDYDENDPEYKRAVAETNVLQSIRVILASVEPGAMTFDATPDAFPKPVEYYRAVRKEMIAFGLSLGDVAMLAKKAMQLSNMDEGAIKAATGDFFDEGLSPSDT